MLECICGAICIVICETNYGKMKKMGKQMQDAGDDEYHEPGIALRCPPAGV